MPDTRQFMLPGGTFMTEQSNDTQWMASGGVFFIEAATASGAGGGGGSPCIASDVLGILDDFTA